MCTVVPSPLSILCVTKNDLSSPTLLGTSERVCLISGSIDGILRIHDFIMEKIKEKPDPTAKMAIDFDHKQPAEREKQASYDPCTLLLCDYAACVQV